MLTSTKVFMIAAIIAALGLGTTAITTTNTAFAQGCKTGQQNEQGFSHSNDNSNDGGVSGFTGMINSDGQCVK